MTIAPKSKLTAAFHLLAACANRPAPGRLRNRGTRPSPRGLAIPSSAGATRLGMRDLLSLPDASYASPRRCRPAPPQRRLARTLTNTALPPATPSQTATRESPRGGGYGAAREACKRRWRQGLGVVQPGGDDEADGVDEGEEERCRRGRGRG